MLEQEAGAEALKLKAEKSKNPARLPTLKSVGLFGIPQKSKKFLGQRKSEFLQGFSLLG